MAEFYMRDLCEKNGLSYRIAVSSAATSGEEIGNGVYPPAAKKLAEHGISCRGKRARRITREDIEKNDYVIVMDEANERNVLNFCRVYGEEFYASARKKIFLLKWFTGEGGSVADPWYTGDFDATWKDVSEGCNALLSRITGDNVC